MKNTYLSSFQKQQYTQYLQSQLEKFSAFMLHQRKENEKYIIIEQTLHQQNHKIQMLTDKIEQIEVYQNQTDKNCQRIIDNIYKIDDIDIRMKKMEYLFDQRCDTYNEKSKNMKNQKKNGINQLSLMNHIENVRSILQKRVQKVQFQIDKHTEAIGTLSRMRRSDKSPLHTNHSERISQNQFENLVEKKELKKMEKKIQKYFSQKFIELEEMINGGRAYSQSRHPTPKSSISISKEKENKDPNFNFKSLSQFNESNSRVRSDYVDFPVPKDKSTVYQSKDDEYAIGKSGKNSMIKKKKKNKSKSKTKTNKNQKEISLKSRSKSRSRSKSPKCQKNSKKDECKSHKRAHSKSKSIPKSLSHSKSKSKSKSPYLKERKASNFDDSYLSKEYKMLCKKKHF